MSIRDAAPWRKNGSAARVELEQRISGGSASVYAHLTMTLNARAALLVLVSRGFGYFDRTPTENFNQRQDVHDILLPTSTCLTSTAFKLGASGSRGVLVGCSSGVCAAHLGSCGRARGSDELARCCCCGCGAGREMRQGEGGR